MLTRRILDLECPLGFIFSVELSWVYKYLLEEFEETVLNKEGIGSLKDSFEFDLNISDEELVI